MTDAPPNVSSVSDDEEPILVTTTVHLGSGRDKIHPGERVLVYPSDPSVAPLLRGGLLVPVRGAE